MEDVAHAEGAGLGQQGEAQVRGRLVVVQLVVGGAEGDEGVVVAAQLAHHVAQAEDGAEDELGVVAALIAPRLGGDGLCRDRLRWADAIGLLLVLVGSGSGGAGGSGDERCRGSRRCGLEPLLRVDTLRWGEEEEDGVLASERANEQANKRMDKEAPCSAVFHRFCLLKREVDEPHRMT